MTVFDPCTTLCSCGTTLSVPLARSLDVSRSTAARAAILRGELHRASCPGCARSLTIETVFHCVDLGRHAFFRVAPRGERHRWQTASGDLDNALGDVPAPVADPHRRVLRIVFGMDELREKLVAQDHGLDDRIVELIKVLVMAEHPVLLRRPRLRLTLDRVTDVLELVAAYEHDARRFRITVPRWVADDLMAQPEGLEAWLRVAAPNSNVFVPPDHWVNIWRWSPQPAALEQLERYAARLRERQWIDTSAAPFVRMLRRLPRGDSLPGWAKRDLRVLWNHARAHQLHGLEDQLLDLRFGRDPHDDWSVNGDPDDVDTLWRLFRELPETDVPAYATFHEIPPAEHTDGEAYQASSHDVAMSRNEMARTAPFADVFRGEIPHPASERPPAIGSGWGINAA